MASINEAFHPEAIYECVFMLERAKARILPFLDHTVPLMMSVELRRKLTEARNELLLASYEFGVAMSKLSISIDSMTAFLALSPDLPANLQFVTNISSAVARDSIQRAPLGTSIGEPQTIGNHKSPIPTNA